MGPDLSWISDWIIFKQDSRLYCYFQNYILELRFFFKLWINNCMFAASSLLWVWWVVLLGLLLAGQGGRGWLAFGDRSRIPQGFRRARICKFLQQKVVFNDCGKTGNLWLSNWKLSGISLKDLQKLSGSSKKAGSLKAFLKCLIRSCRRKYSRINVWVNILNL